MNRKLICLALTAALGLTLCACGQKKPAASSSGETASGSVSGSVSGSASSEGDHSQPAASPSSSQSTPPSSSGSASSSTPPAEPEKKPQQPEPVDVTITLINPRGDMVIVRQEKGDRYVDEDGNVYTFNGSDGWLDAKGLEWNEAVI